MSMSELCPDTSARARKIEKTILRKLASMGQSTVAKYVGVSETTVSRWKSEPAGRESDDTEIQRMSKFLACLGLKTVPIEYECHDPKTLEAMLTLAQQRMSQLKSADQLRWEGEDE
jgi:DNA-binding XRE family transcriptional regulator